MINLNLRTERLSMPDMWGALASGLCLVHCAATPFLFIAKACTATCCNDTPAWWQGMDFLFLGISFVAIFFVARNSNHKWIKHALWVS